MITKVLKWGNSLAFRIPKSYAEDIGLKNDSSVEMLIEKGKLVLMPVRKKKYLLKNLVSMINENNMHKETDTGPPVGKEAW